MTAWELPTQIEVGGDLWDIRYDYKAILDILVCMVDPEYDDCKGEILLTIFYVDFESMSPDLYQEAYDKAVEFIDCGIKQDSHNSPRLMDWEQDAPILIPAINKALGYEVRGKEIHWWTFLSGYMEIGEGLYSNIISIRSKQAKGKKLENYEREFLKENKSLILLKKRVTEEEQREIDAEKQALKELLGG